MKVTLRLVCCFVFVVLLFIESVAFDHVVYAARDDVCVSLLEEGTLYDGQLACAQGPLTYYAAFFSQKLFEQFRTGLFIMAIIMCGIIGMLLFRLCYSYIVAMLVYILVLVPLLFGDFSVLLASFFFFLACFFCLEKQGKNNCFIGGVFAGLALASKSVVLLGIPLLFGLLVFGGKQSLSKRIKYGGLYFLLPCAMMLSVFFIVHPYWLHYSFFSHASANALSVMSTFKAFFVGWNNLFFMQFVLLFGVWCYAFLFVKARSVCLLFFPFFINFFLFAGIDGQISFAHVLDHHQLPFLLFFPIISSKVMEGLKKQRVNKTIFVVLVISIAVYFAAVMPTYYAGSLPAFLRVDRDPGIQIIFSGFLNKIDFTSVAFVDESVYSRLTSEKKEISKFIVSQYADAYRSKKSIGVTDTNYGEGIRELGLVDAKNQKDLVERDLKYNDFIEKNISAELRQNNVQLIAIGVWDYDLVRNVLKPFMQEKEWCLVFVPAVHHAKGFFYRDKKNCDKLRFQLEEYYSMQIENICAIDEVVANDTLNILALKNIVINKTCISGKREYVDVEARKTVVDNVFFLFLFFTLAGLFASEYYTRKMK